MEIGLGETAIVGQATDGYNWEWNESVLLPNKLKGGYKTINLVTAAMETDTPDGTPDVAPAGITAVAVPQSGGVASASAPAITASASAGAEGASDKGNNNK